MSKTKIVYTIKSAFTRNKWTWKIDGEDQVPTRKEIEELLDTAVETLDNAEQSGYIETGRVLIKKDGDHRDVYLWIGDLGEDA